DRLLQMRIAVEIEALAHFGKKIDDVGNRRIERGSFLMASPHHIVERGFRREHRCRLRTRTLLDFGAQLDDTLNEMRYFNARERWINGCLTGHVLVPNPYTGRQWIERL